MSESDISRAIIKWINAQLKCRAIKMHSNRYQGKGEPDIFASFCGRLLVIETKVPGEEPVPIQTHVLDLWRATGAIAITATSVEDVRIQLNQLGVMNDH